MREIVPGAFLYPAFFDAEGQQRLVAQVLDIIAQAPLFTPRMPRTGAPMSVRMTNCGPLGWCSDRERGYRYEPRHPETGAPWPEIPALLLDAWRALAGYPKLPEACLVNAYDESARMGMHQDRDEQDFDAPILSVSLGADCRFRIGGESRGGKTVSCVLSSGDALILGGPARRAFHGVDRILPTLAPGLALPAGVARINLTLRRVS